MAITVGSALGRRKAGDFGRRHVIFVKSACRIERVLCHRVGHFVTIKVHCGFTARKTRFVVRPQRRLDRCGHVECLAGRQLNGDGVMIDYSDPARKRRSRERADAGRAAKSEEEHELLSNPHVCFARQLPCNRNATFSRVASVLHR